MIRILHIDDGRDDLELLRLRMSSREHDVQIKSVSTAAEIARKEYIKEEFDCIVCNYQMPEMDGLKLLKLLRKKNVDIPFILIIGQNNEELVAKALQAGANDCFIKESGSTYDNLFINRVRNLAKAYKDLETRREAELALGDCEETKQILLNAPFEEVLLLDTEGTILDANDLASTRIREGKEEIIGGSAYNIFPADLAKARMEAVKEVIRSCKPVQFEDQTHGRSWANSIYPVFDQTGKVKRVAVYTKDITESRRKEDLLARMRRQQEVILQLGKTALEFNELENFLDLANCFLAEVLNVEYSGIFKVLEDGRKLLLETGTGWHKGQLGLLELPLSAETLFDHTLKSSVPVVVKDFDRESRFSTPSVLADLRIVCGICAAINVNNIPYGILGAFSTRKYAFSEDVIQFFKSIANILSFALDRQQTNQLLRQSKETTRALLDANPEMALLLDAQGTLLAANERARLEMGEKCENPVGKKILELIPTLLCCDRENILERLFKHGIPLRFSDECDGKWFDNSFLPVLDDKGQVGKVAIYMREITETRKFHEELMDSRNKLKRRTHELELLNRELEAFSYSVSHDLRTPLHNIRGISQILKDTYSKDLDEEGQRCLDRLMAACRSMEDLIEDIFRLSQASLGELHKEQIDLSIMARSVADKLMRNDSKRKVKFRIAKDLLVIGDHGLMKAVLENLISNAWKFTTRESQASIQFGKKRVNGKMAFFLKDNGVGFDNSFADKLFTPFQRFHSKKEFEGTGIGLATVKRIVNRHGGKIWAESEKGQGATFFFTIS